MRNAFYDKNMGEVMTPMDTNISQIEAGDEDFLEDKEEANSKKDQKEDKVFQSLSTPKTLQIHNDDLVSTFCDR